jgi:hypothetical protein
MIIHKFDKIWFSATFWAIFLQKHPVTLAPVASLEKSSFLCSSKHCQAFSAKSFCDHSVVCCGTLYPTYIQAQHERHKVVSQVLVTQIEGCRVTG